MVQAPCRDCELRKVGCRSECAAWQLYQEQKAEEHERWDKRSRAARQADSYLKERGMKTEIYWRKKPGTKAKRNGQR